MSPRRTRQAALILVIAAAGAAACVGRSVPVEGAAPVVEEQLGRGSLTEVAATLIVENERMLDYRIYLTRQGGERLGIVRGPGKATFRLRGAQMSHTGDLRIVAVPIASRVAVSGSAQVPWGRTVRFRIMPNDAYLIVDPLPEPKDTTEADSTSKADTTRKPR